MNYWWFTANPEEWKFSDISIGEEVDISLNNEKGNKRRIYANFLKARPGDPVIGYASTPQRKIVALCEISKEQDGKNLWVKKNKDVRPLAYSDFAGDPELQDMQYMKAAQGTLFKLTQAEYNLLVQKIDNQDTLFGGSYFKDYNKESFLKDVFMDEDDYASLRQLLKDKKNVILQGPPGAGKTYAAERLAYSIMEKEDKTRIGFVQFHQSYSYEDFIMGYRPAPERDGFKLIEGVFSVFCNEVRKQPGKDHFFIIDEINRGNVSKIFGEVLSRIEDSYRGKEIMLSYGNEAAFSVPQNLYIIGMMNTADRSLAQIDYALRRRFSFFTMSPAFENDGFKAYQKSLGSAKLDHLIDMVKELNKAIGEDNSLGEGCRIGHSYFCNKDQPSCTDDWLKNVVNFDLIPILAEYWFDDPSKLKDWSKKLRESIQ